MAMSPSASAISACSQAPALLMLSSVPNGSPRVTFLEHFVVDAGTFEEPASGEEETYYANNFSQVHLVGDILLQARNIRELSIERFQPCIVHDIRIGEAVRSLNNLVNLRLFTISDPSLSVLKSSRNNRLARLTLSYYLTEEFPLENETKTLPPLISLLSSFRHLHTVKVWNFDPNMGLPRGETPMPSFPSIRYLRLSEASVPALDLVELCPNLSTLIVSFDWAAETIVSEGPKWPPLRRLMLLQFADALSFYERLSTVNQLQISNSLILNPDSGSSADDPLHKFLAFLRTASPVGLYMCMKGCMETDGQESFWKAVPHIAPRLRSLELQFHPSLSEFDSDDYSWLDKLSVALHALPLVCLRVLVPQEELPRVYMWDAEESEEAKELALTRAREREINRVRALAALPRLLVRAIPSLRFLALGDTAPHMLLLGDTIVGPYITSCK